MLVIQEEQNPAPCPDGLNLLGFKPNEATECFLGKEPGAMAIHFIEASTVGV